MLDFSLAHSPRRRFSLMDLLAVGGSSLLAFALLWWTLTQAFAASSGTPRADSTQRLNAATLHEHTPQ